MASRSTAGFDPVLAAARALGIPAGDLAGEPLMTAAARAWEALDVVSRAALGAVVELGGSAAAATLEDEIATDLEAAGFQAATARSEARRALEASWESGLLSRDRASRTFYLLPEVAEAFAPHVREALNASLPILRDPPPPPLDEHLACCAINLLRHEPLKLTREGTPFRRSLEALAERLGALLPRDRPGDRPGDRAGDRDVERGTVGRVEALAGVLRDLGLLRLAKDALEIDPEAVAEWASLDEAQRAARLLPSEPDAPALRLLRLLVELGPDRSWPVGLAARVLRRSRAAASDDEPAEPLRAAGQQDLAQALARLERAGLTAIVPGVPGSAASAGAPENIALTAIGRSFPAAPEMPRPKGIHVGHDLSVLVPRGLAPSIHARLGDLARLESADQVARYRIDRDVFLEALDRGAAPGDLELFLAESTSPVLPDAVRDDLRRWAERFGEVTSRQGVCVICSAPRRHEEFDAIAARSGLSIAIVAPGVAVVAAEDHAALCQLLAAAGLTPRRRILPLARGPSSAVPLREQAPPPDPDSAPRPDAGLIAAGLAAMPSWLSRFRDEAPRKAAPPPTLVAAQVKEKYRREFGSGQLAALDRLDVDELIVLEDKGLVRQFLAGKIPAPSAESRQAELAEYVGDEMVTVTPARARQVMEQAARASLTCQVAYLQGPGRTQKLLVNAIELVTDGAGTYVRARIPGSAQERMLATDRIHAVRVVPR